MTEYEAPLNLFQSGEWFVVGLVLGALIATVLLLVLGALHDSKRTPDPEPYLELFRVYDYEKEGA